MMFVRLDVAKNKHDCFIISSDDKVLADVFTIANSKEGFEKFLHAINTCTSIDESKIKIGFEDTEHYSYNLLEFLLDNSLFTYAFNSLHTNLYPKSFSMYKTKVDCVNSRIIISMLISDVSLKPYANITYHYSELKSLTRYCFDKIRG